jgi:hypothetical protein
LNEAAFGMEMHWGVLGAKSGKQHDGFPVKMARVMSTERVSNDFGMSFSDGSPRTGCFRQTCPLIEQFRIKVL